MSTPLRILVDEAIHKVNTYKRPNIDEAIVSLRAVLQAMGTGAPAEHDGIESMSEYDDALHIQTAYSVRCCAMSDEFEIPNSIIDAADPIAAAKAWGWKRKVDEASTALTQAEAAVERARDRLNKVLEEDPFPEVKA